MNLNKIRLKAVLLMGFMQEMTGAEAEISPKHKAVIDDLYEVINGLPGDGIDSGTLEEVLDELLAAIDSIEEAL